jgi:hypothetical protein
LLPADQLNKPNFDILASKSNKKIEEESSVLQRKEEENAQSKQNEQQQIQKAIEQELEKQFKTSIINQETAISVPSIANAVAPSTSQVNNNFPDDIQQLMQAYIQQQSVMPTVQQQSVMPTVQQQSVMPTVQQQQPQEVIQLVQHPIPQTIKQPMEVASPIVSQRPIMQKKSFITAKVEEAHEQAIILPGGTKYFVIQEPESLENRTQKIIMLPEEYSYIIFKVPTAKDAENQARSLEYINTFQQKPYQQLSLPYEIPQ